MFKTIKSFIRSFCLSALIIFGAILAPEAHNKYLRWEVGESVVQVLGMMHDGGGTGFAIRGASGKNYIMTNRHVCGVQSNGVIRIKETGKAPVYRKVVYMDTVHDLCLIEGLDHLAPLTLGSNPEKGDYHYVVGHPGLRQLTTSQGEFIGKTSVDLNFEVKRRSDCPGKVVEIPDFFRMIYGIEFLCMRKYLALGTTAVIYPGNSGSPVVNKWGNLIGVAFAGSTQQERDNYLVPLAFVKRVLNNF